MSSIFAELSKEKYAPLDREKERELLARAKNGDEEAKRELVERNLRYVAKMASKYASPGTDKYLELISAGTIGLYEAIERFDLGRGVRFLTFASAYIFHHIYLELTKDLSLLKLNSNERRIVVAMYRLVPELEKELGRYPTPDEVVDALKSRLNLSVSKEMVENVMHKTHLVLSIDAIEEEKEKD